MDQKNSDVTAFLLRDTYSAFAKIESRINKVKQKKKTSK